jgi:hypothetical protein
MREILLGHGFVNSGEVTEVTLQDLFVNSQQFVVDLHVNCFRVIHILQINNSVFLISNSDL